MSSAQSHVFEGALPDLSPYLLPGDSVMWGQVAAQPLLLTTALTQQRHRFARLRLVIGAGVHDTPGPEHADAFDFLSYAGAGTNRALAKAGVLDIMPCHYSQLPGLIRSGQLRIDVLMLQVSPPDSQGRHSLGLANEYLLAALDSARVVLGEINPNVPWTHGERTLVAEEFHLLVHSDYTLPDKPAPALTVAEKAIGAHVAGLIEDGSTLQLGLGGIPEAVLAALAGHRDLGIHSGAIADGVATLTESGVITNARKSIDRGVTVAGVLMGGHRLHKFAHLNRRLKMRGTEYTHAASVLASIDRFVALNSAIEVDLTGQVNAEVAGDVYVGAVGGAVDFLRGAHRSKGGLPVVALQSTSGSRSRIVAKLSGPVSTPRCDAGVFVTEYGAVDLRGLSLMKRVDRMLSIAHPEYRAALEQQARGV